MVVRRGLLSRVAAVIAIVALPSFFAACSVQARKLPITYVPQQNVQAIKGANAVAVEVTVEDLEPDEYQSRWPNPFGEATRLRFQVKDASGTVKSAAESELKTRGFAIASGGALVTIQIDRFAAETESDNWDFDASAHGYFSMRIQVRPSIGNALFSKTVRGEGDPLSGRFWSLGLHPATHELQESLTDALKGLFDDPAFTAAILAAGHPPPAKPSSPGRIVDSQTRFDVALRNPNVSRRLQIAAAWVRAAKRPQKRLVQSESAQTGPSGPSATCLSGRPAMSATPKSFTISRWSHSWHGSDWV